MVATSTAPVGKDDLHAIGSKIAAAVLARDSTALLAYDRADLRAGDEQSLRNTKDNLYCFIFDSGCISGNWKSVYEKLSSARDLGIRTLVNRSSTNGRTYGLLLFYDRAQIPDKSLESDEFLCTEGPTKLVTWKFEMKAEKWVAVTPLFDYGTEGLCSE
jgi:hypothetical protein